ncbi:AMP-binding protein [Burkholderia cenocepacia]|uniref:acyl-CoA synthetase family protein n=1 Tax=Burkholderia cenocepacia TaxID=95486 RepID=UPI00078E70E4|nr:acyl-CoA synthetase family protein [Burkholderia cenocepacia]AMU16852.1 beta-hydroxyacyl-ACP dehydratase [Burkholderia cenocepacia]ARF86047.1 acyl-CoA synthetase AMP-(fatty) acid ligase/(3R)-hydroxymyristoyl-[ACP] dehydratase [Burkholderia cenocepacia]MBR7941310.1 acyl-CoA synthetase family protein [Burkholderia cenocepacia]MBR8477209.1 acyl-CoA synthetase family protein [Burkholderia cenocepacia]MCW3584269.1 AMP-binding protein [Burkholderia cenocepacia]
MPTHPLVFHSSPDRTIAWRDGSPVTVRAFVADVARVAAALPAGGHVFNVCRDRYRFAVSLCAALVAGKISLLPSTHTPEMVRQLASFAPDAFCLHDAPDCAIDLPRFAYPDAAPGEPAADAPFAVPQIDAARIMAYVFTSGSTGAPVPHRKTWGFLVGCVRAAAERLGLLDGRAATLIGTVPAQHMYGFESTVLLALIGGLAFSNRQPFYPSDIRDELDALPQPRVLVTSPIHLRALLSAGHALPRAALVLSATAPLSEKLAREAEAALDAPLVEIYGSTETGQIATRRTSQGAAWERFPDIRLDARDAPDGDDSGPTVWVSGGHVEAPVPMGDALELLGDGRFLLHGRKADLVNIAGKRTSLAYLNHQLNAIAEVVDGVFFMPDEATPAHGDTTLEPITRLVALVVAPTLSAADLQRALRERIDPAFMPRPLVFVDALPRNETGKLPRDVLAALVAQHARASGATPTPPAGRDPARTPSSALAFTIAADHPALPGHFPGHPVVPGVVLLDHAIHMIGAAMNRPLHAWRLGSAKFLSPVAPGEPLDLAYDAAASGAIRFTVRTGSREVATGVLSAPPSVQDGAQP